MTKEEEDAPVVTATEARQGRHVGLIWVLIIGLVLAAIAGALLVLYY